VAGACSKDPGTIASTATTTTGVASPLRPQGAAAALSPATGGNGIFLLSSIPSGVKEGGYVEHEFLAAGDATSYTASAGLPEDGRWTFTPAATAPYRTRIVVRQPADNARFSGTVVVEWLNVSGGVDSDPGWMTTHEELMRRGDAWVGVTTQHIGVAGGEVLVPVKDPRAVYAGKGLVATDPARYGTLEHPGDGYSFDIYTQVARAVRTGEGLSGLHPKRLVAVGQSQSAYALVTYYDGVQPLTDAFDGFLLISRGGSSLPLVGPGQAADLAGSLAGSTALIRTDLDAPVLDVQSEADLLGILGSYAARQPDGPNFRLWEIAGTAHYDQHLLGDTTKNVDCGVEINNGPLHVVSKAGLHALQSWVERGALPPEAPRLDVATAGQPLIVRDQDGIAKGGIRTPLVDVPVATLSGTPGPNSSIACILFGSTIPFTDQRLAELYPSRADYVRRFASGADAAIRGGFVLRADRAALLDYAEPSRIPR
jgi:hypothetical protein